MREANTAIVRQLMNDGQPLSPQVSPEDEHNVKEALHTARSAGNVATTVDDVVAEHSEILGKGDHKPNYNDDYNLSVRETVSKLVDTSKVIELELIDPDSLPKKTGYRILKRAFDIVGSSVALVLCALPMGIIAILVKADSPGPVFYRQERLGLNGKPITITKFRSMREDAEATGPQWADGEDPRVTKIGAKLRQSRLDELPQIWAVIKGDLSLVGPRPERKVFYNAFEKYIHGFSQRMLVTPGISGLAQVNGGYDLLPAEKVVYDLEYVKNRSLSMDLMIVFKTIGVIFSHEGAR